MFNQAVNVWNSLSQSQRYGVAGAAALGTGLFILAAIKWNGRIISCVKGCFSSKPSQVFDNTIKQFNDSSKLPETLKPSSSNTKIELKPVEPKKEVKQEVKKEVSKFDFSLKIQELKDSALEPAKKAESVVGYLGWVNESLGHSLENGISATDVTSARDSVNQLAALFDELHQEQECSKTVFDFCLNRVIGKLNLIEKYIAWNSAYQKLGKRDDALTKSKLAIDQEKEDLYKSACPAPFEWLTKIFTEVNWLNPSYVFKFKGKSFLVVDSGRKGGHSAAKYDVWIKVEKKWLVAKYDIRLKDENGKEIKEYCGYELDLLIETLTKRFPTEKYHLQAMLRDKFVE